MKTSLFLLFFSLSIHCFSQSDSIFKMNGEIMPVNVTEVNNESIKFNYPNESISNSIGISSVLRIHFKSGRIQEFASVLNVKQVKSCLEWENVQISNIESEVKGLSKIDVVNSKAKGLTAYSSLSKLQDRTYNKIKVETAMLGGNVVYIIEQHTEDSMFGGKYGSTKMPGVTISGLAYTSKKTFPNDITVGNYNVEGIYNLETNAYEYAKVSFKPQTISIKKSDIYSENDFQKIKLNIIDFYNGTVFTIIHASQSEIVLSYVDSTSKGKKTYYNIILKK